MISLVRSFVDLDARLDPVPAPIVRNLALIERAVGAEDRYRRLMPTMLDSLTHRARIESVRASSAIEDVVVEPARLQRIVRSGAAPRTRPEEEVAGYRDALDHVLNSHRATDFDVTSLLRLHRLLYSHIDYPGGRFKSDDNTVIDNLGDGQRLVRFKPVPVGYTDFFVRELYERFHIAMAEGLHHPILIVGAYVLDLLVIHPFDNGNGRVARLATTALLDQAGYDVVRYVSVEGLVDRTSDAYYRTLKQSTDGWHDGRHDLWPWLGYLTTRLAEGYEQFEQLVDQAQPSGTKADQVADLVLQLSDPVFTRGEIRQALPHVSEATITRVLQDLRRSGRIRLLGRGQDARWEREGQP